MIDIEKIASLTPTEVLQNNSFGRGILSRRQIFMHEFIYNMKKIDDSVFTSKVDGIIFILDTIEGKVYKIVPSYHWLDVKSEKSNIYVRDTNTPTWYSIYSTSQGFDFGPFSKGINTGETTTGTGKYRALTFQDYELYGLKIKVHIIIAATKYGYDILNAMEMTHSHVIHHKNSNKNDDSINNLQLLTNSEHRRIEAEIRRNKKTCSMNLNLVPSII